MAFELEDGFRQMWFELNSYKMESNCFAKWYNIIHFVGTKLPMLICLAFPFLGLFLIIVGGEGGAAPAYTYLKIQSFNPILK